MLNRTVRLARRPAGSQKPDAETVSRLADSEKFLAEMTRELGEFLEACANERCELLFQAEDAMLASAKSLSEAEFQDATTSEKDALALLIKARNKVKMALAKAGQQAIQQFRSFDRTQAQKIRRPKSEEEEKEQVASRLRELADKEEIVYATLSGIKLADRRQPTGQEDASRQDRSQQQGQQASQTQQGPQEQQETGGRTESQDRQEAGGGRGGPAGMDRDELEDLQHEVVGEAHAIQRIMQDLDEVTELARSRMAEATKRAEQAAGALARGNSDEAAKASDEAGRGFRQLAEHVDGLLAGETSQRVAASRDLANRLAQRQRDLTDAVPESTRPGLPAESSPRDRQDASGSSTREDLADRAATLAESARTLEDLLKALADAGREGDSEAIREIRRILTAGEVALTVERLEEVRRLLHGGVFVEARVESRRVAELLEALGLKLDTLHRLIVAPEIEELMALEQRAAELRERLSALRSEVQIDQWHFEADALLRELEQGSLGGQEVDGLLDAMRETGWGGVADTGWTWRRIGPYYAAPGEYGRLLDVIVQQLQAQIHELLLRDLIASGDEATPPGYEEFVDRYFQVLSERAGRPE